MANQISSTLDLTFLKFNGIFLGTSGKEAGTQERALMHTKKQPTQVISKLAHMERGDVPTEFEYHATR